MLFAQPSPEPPDPEDDITEDAIDAQAKTDAAKIKARRRGEAIVDAEEAQLRRCVTRPLSTYIPGNTDWLWENRIPIGEITMLAGKAGIGKSTVLTTFASWLTNGKMRGAYYGNPCHVLYVPNEDSVEKALLPRLMAAGADLDRVHTLRVTNTTDDNSVPLILPEDCERLAQSARQLNAIAVFLDPLSSNMSDKDRNRPEVRQSYERLRRCAEYNNLAIVGNGHLRKGASADLLEGILGSSEIGNIVRAGIGIIVDPDSEARQMILSQCKNNYGPMGIKSYVYRITPKSMWTDHGTIHGTYLEWQESTDRQVNDLMAEGMTMDGSQTDVAECVQWLKEYLSLNADAPRKEVIRDAAKESIKEHTLKRAAKRLRVVSRMSGYPASSRWNLPIAQVIGLEPDGT